ncbi:ArsR/SmtB family transcription factor [Amycolatopsis anabasis]|uniref:ArsR/SmtB family transcription factor n=1 Tax=Amycolatopsis anabasis TaxID=1840409 RepID=UPI00131C866D|nr:metalloregulator ArsR/SmtB family transcription factor [Amycolatopsis anabasis]
MTICGRDGEGGDADVAAVAALFGEPARARILLALAANHELPATALAIEAGLSTPATSAHLRKLLEGGLVAVTQAGRFRYYRIAGAEIAATLETLAGLAPPRPVQSLRQSRRGQALRFARICYDHLAGDLSVAITDALIARDAIRTLESPGSADRHWVLGPRAPQVLGELGIRTELEGAAPLRTCHDWSARRPHLAGPLGTSLLTALLERGMLARVPRQRAVTLTEAGTRILGTTLDLTTPS